MVELGEVVPLAEHADARVGLQAEQLVLPRLASLRNESKFFLDSRCHFLTLPLNSPG